MNMLFTVFIVAATVFAGEKPVSPNIPTDRQELAEYLRGYDTGTKAFKLGFDDALVILGARKLGDESDAMMRLAEEVRALWDSNRKLRHENAKLQSELLKLRSR